VTAARSAHHHRRRPRDHYRATSLLRLFAEPDDNTTKRTILMTNGRKTRQRRQDQRLVAARWTITVPGATIPASPFPPGSHPGNDKILVVWPDVPPGLDKTALGEWLAASHPPEAVRTIVDEVTRDEFVRRLAGLDIVSQVNANPLVRVVALVEPAALLRWAASAAEPLERTTAAQFPSYPQPSPMTPEAPSRLPDASGRVRLPAVKFPRGQGFRRRLGIMPEFGRRRGKAAHEQR